MFPLSEARALAAAINEYQRFQGKRKLKHVSGDRDEKLFNSEQTGWRVHFVFEQVDGLADYCLTIEVTDVGETSVFLSM